MRRGLLLTMTEPPPAMDEEFNAWYDTEHLAERLAIPGFRSTRRWVADLAPGEGRYLATYELDSAAVLQSPAYLARYQGPTPWSRRCMGATVAFRRWACEQVDPGSADPHPDAKAILLLASDQLLRFEVKAALQTRRFVANEGGPPHILLAELASHAMPAVPAAPGALVRLYRAYAA